MFDQPKNPSFVQPQPLPDRISSLHSRVKWADRRLIAMDQLAVDVHDQLAILFVELLQHGEWAECKIRRVAGASFGRRSNRHPPPVLAAPERAVAPIRGAPLILLSGAQLRSRVLPHTSAFQDFEDEA